MTNPDLVATPLPTWEECEATVLAGTTTPLQVFIFFEETTAPDDAVFRQRLIAVLNSIDTAHQWYEPPTPNSQSN